MIEVIDKSKTKTLLEGNIAILANFWNQWLKKSDVSVAYFGDDYFFDVKATHEL
jgi:hypothetical protein